jgi:tRNA-specific 2-thiouridylase
VARKDLARNALIVVQGDDHPLLYSGGLRTGPVHWLATVPRSGRLNCQIKTRYRQRDQACTVEFTGDGSRVSFEAPQRSVTPGQFAVFYRGEECLGGAVIESTADDGIVTGSRRALPVAMPI